MVQRSFDVFRFGDAFAQITHVCTVPEEIAQLRVEVFQLHAFLILSAIAFRTITACFCR